MRTVTFRVPDFEEYDPDSVRELRPDEEIVDPWNDPRIDPAAYADSLILLFLRHRRHLVYIPTWEELGFEATVDGEYRTPPVDNDGWVSATAYRRNRTWRVVLHCDDSTKVADDEPEARWWVAVLKALEAGL